MKLRKEITLINAIKVVTATGFVELDTNDYPNATYYFEVVARNAGTVTLQRVTGGTDDATITTSGVTFSRFRSTSFTPPAGATEYKMALSGATVNTARIVIIQNASPITATQTQIEIGCEDGAKTNTASAPLIYPKYYKHTAANWDGTVTYEVEVVWNTQTKNTCTITIQQDNGSFGSWADHTTIVSAGSNTAVQRTRVSFTPTDGRNYRMASLGSTSKSVYYIYGARVIVTQTGSPTKTQSEYLLINGLDNNTTNNQDYDTLWDSSEWSGVTNTYYHVMDSDNASNSADLVDIDNSDTQVTNSSVTGANRQVSSALTMPTTGHQIDTDIDNTTGVIAASRILVVSVEAVVAADLKPAVYVISQSVNRASTY